eukprot:6772009-Prymnesium_polylepis.1
MLSRSSVHFVQPSATDSVTVDSYSARTRARGADPRSDRTMGLPRTGYELVNPTSLSFADWHDRFILTRPRSSTLYDGAKRFTDGPSAPH